MTGYAGWRRHQKKKNMRCVSATIVLAAIRPLLVSRPRLRITAMPSNDDPGRREDLCLVPGRRAFGASARSSHEDSGKSRVWIANDTGRSAGALLVITMADGWSQVYEGPGSTVLRNEVWVS